MTSQLDTTRAGVLVLALAALAVLVHAGAARTQTPAAPLEELSAFPKSQLTVSGGGGRHQFSIWVADTAAREEQGLMFVRELPANQGMVFVAEAPKVWNMWMKNTFIPLDMLFVGVDGHVLKIAHAIPHDESIVSSDVPVHAVIELQGGICEKLHIRVGDSAKWGSAP